MSVPIAESSMPRPVRRTASQRRMIVSGVVLVVVGVVCLIASRTAGRSEGLSYAPGAVAPTSVVLTRGHRYGIALPGGVAQVASLAVVLRPTSCTVHAPRLGLVTLRITAEGRSTKATQQIASFVSPVDGRAVLSCFGLPPVFVDDADSAPFDRSGLLVLLSSIMLLAGGGLSLAGLRRAPPVTSR